MKTKLVPIGNSFGVRIPRALIEEAHLHGDLEMTIDGESLVVRRLRRPRAGWEEAFAALSGDDVEPFDDFGGNDFDETEWTWPE